ncbi:hypothetical protein AB5J72_00005 [Streptomyces sp. CG1]|uniref:hypothetical protein n=1 Tax=Streptomyces sp. CG1 TaxID=1287523 RepID=UPI0034E2C398
MRFGVEVGPFYASTSTRRRYRSRSGGSGGGCAIALVVLALGLFVWPWVAAFHSRTVAGHVVGGIFAGLEVVIVVAAIAAMEAKTKAARASGKSAPPTSKQEQVRTTVADDRPPYLRSPRWEQNRRR